MDKIELIFNMYKDSVVISKPFKAEMIRKYRLSDESIRNLFIRILNYQIEEFGGRLTYEERAFSTQEKNRANQNSRQRAYERRSRRWENKRPQKQFVK